VANHPSTLVMEFNELCPTLIERFMADGKLPNFRRLKAESHTFITEADEQAPYLEPWIQWVTVHSGHPFRTHKIENLDDADKFAEKRVWDLLSDAGHPVWICGSMNASYAAPLKGALLPDPWSARVTPSDDSLLPYFRFIQQNVQEYANDRVPLTGADYARFVAFMATHGLRLETARAIATQLLDERLHDARWKRASILDRLQLDVFRWYHRKLKPHFATFFINSTAHYQHLYWRNLDPQLFSLSPSADEQKSYGGAILYGYQQMDRIVGEFLDLCDDATTLVFCTALSQQPCIKYEEIGGKRIYRPRDFDKLMAFLGITSPHRVAPVMSQEFKLYFENEADAKEAERRLNLLLIGDAQVLTGERLGSEIIAAVRSRVEFDTSGTVRIEDRSARFSELFYRLEGLKSGMHHPDGLFWVRTPAREGVAHPEKIPLISVAPTLLATLSVPAPRSMPGTPVSLHAPSKRAAVG
jgi:predicted AlkP superfamily phosphohydrolase/phosphomutase